MNSKWIRGPVLTLLSVGLLIGCAHHPVVVREPAQVIVVQQPPAPRIETPTMSPGAGYTWAPGNWEWNGKRYIWHQGQWVLAPHSGAVWMEGHWEKQPNGWIWMPGRWM